MELNLFPGLAIDGHLTSVASPQGLCASRVLHHAEEAGEAVGDSAEHGAVSGGGGASPGRASASTHGSLLEAPQAAVSAGGGPIQSGGGAFEQESWLP